MPNFSGTVDLSELPFRVGEDIGKLLEPLVVKAVTEAVQNRLPEAQVHSDLMVADDGRLILSVSWDMIGEIEATICLSERVDRYLEHLTDGTWGESDVPHVLALAAAFRREAEKIEGALTK